MSNHFTPDADDEIPQKKSSQQLLLLLLLLLVALFAYLYFFTGLIKPRETAPKPEVQLAPEKLVKQPLPPRAEQQSAEPAAPGAKPAATAAAPPAAATPAQEAKPAQPAAPPAAKPAAPAPVAKPAAPPAPVAKPAQPAAPAPQAKTAPAPQAKATAAQAKPAKPVTAKEAKPAAAVEKQASAAPAAGKKAAATPATVKKGAAAAAAVANGAQKKAAAEKTVAVTSGKEVAAKPGAAGYALEIDGDLLESESAGVVAKLKRAGVSPVLKTKAQKNETMHRLFLADFGNRDEALEELERLKLAAPTAFMLRENGRYAVYAGSYLREAKASVEQDRLYAQGVKLLIKSATLPVPVVRLRGGSFADPASAGKAASNLKKAGLSAKVVKVDR